MFQMNMNVLFAHEKCLFFEHNRLKDLLMGIINGQRTHWVAGVDIYFLILYFKGIVL